MERTEREIQSQTPIRDLAGVWVLDGKLKSIRPVIAQCLVRVKTDCDEWTEVGFLTYDSGNGLELTGCRYAFPRDRYGDCLLLPVSSTQWKRLFGDSVACLAVAKEIGDEFDFLVTGWNA